jgi:hypothetical protein
MVTVLFKTFLVRLYIALDKTQRERAAKIIRQYGHLISKRDENSAEQEKALLSEDAGHKPRQGRPGIGWNRERRGSRS